MNAIVIGVGNRFHRDDGVGPAVADLLASADGVEVAESDGEATALINLWTGRRLAVLVDAVRAEPSHPGRIHRLALVNPPGERSRAASSHGLDLGDTVELARVLGRLPDRMVIYAVEAADTGFGVGLTPAVAAAAQHLAEEITAELTAEITAEARVPAA